MIPYDVQMLGAIAMHYGAIAEMQTGEGKTLTAAMPLYLNALTGKPVHLVTVNDYLAQRDCEWIGAIFRWFGPARSCSHRIAPRITYAKASMPQILSMELPLNSASTICATTRWLRTKKSSANAAIILQSSTRSTRFSSTRRGLLSSFPARTAGSRQMYDDSERRCRSCGPSAKRHLQPACL